MAAYTYNPDIFSVTTPGEAKEIILTEEAGVSSEERWVTETPYLAEIICDQVALTTESVVLDYGCGIGRLARELIARRNCFVIGVDISPPMRELARGYVDSDKFIACAPATLDGLLARGLRADAAISVWVLQHCLRPAQDVARIRAALQPGSRFLLVNNFNRVVPTVEEAWTDDGIDIHALVSEHFQPLEQWRLDSAYVAPNLYDCAYWATFSAT